jgi:hypothetical protein
VDEIVSTNPRGTVSVATFGESVYWGTLDGLVQARDPAGEPVTLYDGGNQTIHEIGAVAVDETFVYYIRDRKLFSVAKVGGESPTLVAKDLGHPIAIHVEPGAIYLLDYGAGDFMAPGRVLRVTADGVVGTILDGVSQPSGFAFDTQDVYVAGFTAESASQPIVFRTPKTGGAVSVFASGSSSTFIQAGHIAVDENFLYLTAAVVPVNGPRLLAFPKGGGAPLNLGDMPSLEPLDLVIDGTTSYVIGNIGSVGIARLVRFHVGSPVGDTLATIGGARYSGLAETPTAIYWGIYSTPPDELPDGANVRKLCK